MHSYAGIGSREITSTEEGRIHRIAEIMQMKGYLLYSGGADGSDHAFEVGSGGYGVSFLPWPGFNAQLESKTYKVVFHSKESEASVNRWHPMPSKLTRNGRLFMSRNYFQVNGAGGLPRVDFVICCATRKRDEVSGGTGQAVRIANSLKIPVINIRDAYWEREINFIPNVTHASRTEIEESLP